jgi:hypothetical protein
MGTETRKPDLPNCTYSALLFSSDVFKLWGISPAILPFLLTSSAFVEKFCIGARPEVESARWERETWTG